MKLLIAYDGSECAESALDDLTHAGLPAKGEALVMSCSRSLATTAASLCPGDCPVSS